MDQAALRTLLEKVRDSRVSPDQAIHQLRHLPFEDVGFAKIDHHRTLRVGMPEVIYSAGKTPEQVAEIFVRRQNAAAMCSQPVPIERSLRQSTHASHKQNFIPLLDASFSAGVAKSAVAA
jgi:NCAIR mutase (PurE)-related protein